MQFYRHGDVLLYRVDKLPEGLVKREDGVLVEGETTGHAHRVDPKTKLYNLTAEPTSDNGYTVGYLEVETETELTHEEHDTIILQPGIYQFGVQREYDELEERRVID